MTLLCYQDFLNNSSPIDLDLGPPIDAHSASNYKAIKEVLERLTSLCQATDRKPKKHEQRLLRNMGAHSVVLELLQIPFEKVTHARATWREFLPHMYMYQSNSKGLIFQPLICQQSIILLYISPVLLKYYCVNQGTCDGVVIVDVVVVVVVNGQNDDTRMLEVMKLAHRFLQSFCHGNHSNQVLLHRHLDLFLTPGVSQPLPHPGGKSTSSSPGGKSTASSPQGNMALFPHFFSCTASNNAAVYITVHVCVCVC